MKAILVEDVPMALELRPDRLDRLRRARGIWKDRSDLPELSELREEMNRF